MASITWREGVAYAVWWVKDPDTGRRKQKRRTLETRSASVALSRLAVVDKELEAERWGETAKPDMLFEHACRQWQADHFVNLRPRAAQRYEVSLVHLRLVLDGTPIAGLTRARLLEFETARRRTGVTPSTIRKDFSCLSSMLSYCVEREWIEVNPVPAYKKRRRRFGLKEGKARTRYFSIEEERRILARVNPPDAPIKAAGAAIVFAIETGLRTEEQFSGRWRHVRWGLAPVFAVEDGKGGFSREVPLTERALEVLTRLRRQRPHAGPDEFIFAHAGGDRFLTLDKSLRAACRRAGVFDVRWHDLRRTCGCRLLQERGFSIEQVRDWLGHKDVKTTQRSYAFLSLRNLQRATAESEARLRRRNVQSVHSCTPLNTAVQPDPTPPGGGERPHLRSLSATSSFPKRLIRAGGIPEAAKKSLLRFRRLC